MVIVGAMVTADGRVRVEAVRHLGMDWYRIVYDNEVVADNLVVGMLDRAIRERCNVELSSLIEM